MRSKLNWQDKVVLVTGASQGLGYAIASAFGQRGAQVVLVARNPSRLQEAASRLEASGLQKPAHVEVCDVGSADDVQKMVSAVVARFGRLDVLVNNVGLSMRQDVLTVTAEEFQQSLASNLSTTVNCTQAVAAHLTATKGHLVNIGSLASRLAPRYMGAYPVAKFAVAAYTQQVRLALHPQGVHVLLVCPGPIHRDTPRTYDTPAGQEVPAAARQPAGGAKTKSISPDRLAQQIVTACEKRKLELVVPGKARLLMIAAQCSPRLGDWLLKRFTSS